MMWCEKRGFKTINKNNFIGGKVKITKAFKRNITNDFICGLSSDIINKYDLGDDPDTLLNNKLALIEYTKFISPLSFTSAELEVTLTS